MSATARKTGMISAAATEIRCSNPVAPAATDRAAAVRATVPAVAVALAIVPAAAVVPATVPVAAVVARKGRAPVSDRAAANGRAQASGPPAVAAEAATPLACSPAGRP